MDWNWQKVIVYVFAVLVFGTICFLLGRSSKTPDPPSIVIKEHFVHDTTFAKPKPPIIIHDTTYATRDKTTFTDSTSKSESGASVKVKHTITEIDKDLEKYPSYWKIDFIPPPERIIKETVTRDSIRTITEIKFLSRPFFLNEWFYISLFELIITALAIIF